MRILYVANHNCGHLDDEGTIAHVLESLGHDVVRVNEKEGKQVLGLSGDLLLFHKWSDSETLNLMRGKLPRVFWYFDLVEYPSDPELTRRCDSRKAWMRQMIPNVELGFCTDGDWVKRWHYTEPGKLHWLTQGFDDRVQSVPRTDKLPFVFVGTRNGGKTRASFVDEMVYHYGGEFTHTPSGTYREELAKHIAKAGIVLVPDGPVTSDYWSNRVWWMTGLGGCVFHPYCAKLAEMYETKKEIVFYHSRPELHDLIKRHRDNREKRWKIGEAGQARARADHTYTKRVQQLLQMIEEQL